VAERLLACVNAERLHSHVFIVMQIGLNTAAAVLLLLLQQLLINSVERCYSTEAYFSVNNFLNWLRISCAVSITTGATWHT